MAPGHVGAPSVDLQGKGQEEGDKTLLVELGFRSVGPVEPLGYHEPIQTLEMSNKREEPVLRQSSEIPSYPVPLPQPVDIDSDGRPICSLEPSGLQRVDGAYSAPSMNMAQAHLIALESEIVPHRLCEITRSSRCLWMVVALIVVLAGAATAGAVYATQGNRQDTGKSEPIRVLPSIETPGNTISVTTVTDSNVIPNQTSISPSPTVDLQPPSFLKTGDYDLERPLKYKYDGYCRNLNETDPLSVARCPEIMGLIDSLTIGRGTAQGTSTYWVQYQLGTLLGTLTLEHHPEEHSFQSVTGKSFKQRDFYQSHVGIYREEEVQDSDKSCFYHRIVDHFVFKDGTWRMGLVWIYPFWCTWDMDFIPKGDPPGESKTCTCLYTSHLNSRD